MARSPASAIDKRDSAAPPKVEVLTVAKGNNYPPGRMLVSSPLELDAIVRRIPSGRVLTMGALRDALARNHRADYTCAITTGIFLRIVAEAAEEERAAGARVAPYWRVVRDDGTLNDKLPGGVEAQARVLSAEGVTVLHLGKLPRVTEVSHFAWTPPPLGKSPRKLDREPTRTRRSR
jgi:alkylated DNA nucleotide flippase Atl1